MSLPMPAIYHTLLISLLLAGCASSKDTLLPQDGPTMRDVYDAHVHRNEGGDRQVHSAITDLRPPGHPVDAVTEAARADDHPLSARFRRVANPTLRMYVFAHLAGVHRVPVPGYHTVFPLYERVEYALPGESSVATP